MKDTTKKEQLEFLNQYFLSTKEAMSLINVSQQTFYELLRRKKVSKVNFNGAVLYRKDELNHLIKIVKYREDDNVQ